MIFEIQDSLCSENNPDYCCGYIDGCDYSGGWGSGCGWGAGDGSGYDKNGDGFGDENGNGE